MSQDCCLASDNAVFARGQKSRLGIRDQQEWWSSQAMEAGVEVLDADDVDSTFTLLAGSNNDNALYRAPGINASNPLE